MRVWQVPTNLQRWIRFNVFDELPWEPLPMLLPGLPPCVGNKRVGREAFTFCGDSDLISASPKGCWRFSANEFTNPSCCLMYSLCSSPCCTNPPALTHESEQEKPQISAAKNQILSSHLFTPAKVQQIIDVHKLMKKILVIAYMPTRF